MKKHFWILSAMALSSFSGPLLSEDAPSSSPAVFLGSSPCKEMLSKKIDISRCAFTTPSSPLSLKAIRQEEETLQQASLYAIWIEKRGRDSRPFFDLGRFLEKKDKPLIVGIEEGHPMRSEMVERIRQLRRDAKVVDSIEALSIEIGRALPAK